MPNTLAHLGIQTLVTRAVLRDADVKWIWTGCVLPDLPWIGQRVARVLVPESTYLDIRLYAIVQSSLMFCLVASAALACLSDRPRRVFGVLAAGCALHLVLDGLQTKWANGVHLFAPLSWETWNAGLFWPEDWLSLALTLLGLAVAAYALLRMPGDGRDLVWPRGTRLAVLIGLAVAWIAGPMALLDGPRTADAHFARTLAETGERAGRPIGFDRRWVLETPEGPVLHAWTGERIALTGAVPDMSGIYSLKGNFRDPATIEVTATHAHPKSLRDKATYLGLTLVLLLWARVTWRVIRPHIC